MEQEEKKPTTLTGVDLSQTASLLLPWTHDPWGKLRPPLSEEALCMSANSPAPRMAWRLSRGSKPAGAT